MKKKPNTILFILAIFLTFTPVHSFAQECTTHTWGEWYEIFSPTCTEDGTQGRKCEKCHKEETKPIPAIGHHSWGKWKTGKRATALSKGTKTRSCSECYKTQKKPTPKLKAKVSLKKKSATIVRGKHYTIKMKSKTYGDKVQSWKSSNKKIATVNSRGKVTGKKKGVATITLKMKSGAKATCKIKVTNPKQNNGQQPGGSEPGSSNENDTPSPAPSGYVWIPNTGTKYHTSSSCSNMKNPRKVSLQDAINAGYGPCSKCH